MTVQFTGSIIVASTAAFLPGPLMAVYYASKAYVLSFSQALSEELKGTGVFVSVLCPGPTNTGFVKRANMHDSKAFHGDNMNASEVARIAYNGLTDNKTLIVPGIRNKLETDLVRFVPRSILARVVRKMLERV